MVIRIGKHEKTALVIIGISLIIRAFFAAVVELGNDEVYYWLYAGYPALSYFDHPPGLAVAIRLFSFNLSFDSEFFLRLSSVLLTTLNGYIVYRIAAIIKSKSTAIIALILYYSTIYTSVISGIFIIPDGPLSTLWLAAIFFFLRAFGYDSRNRKAGINLLLAGLATGLAISTKYHAVFLWAGAGGYILFKRREFLKNPYLWISVIITAAGTLPVIVWNIQNDWISFRFHEGRVTPGMSVNPLYLFREISGELIYQNPVVYIIFIFSLINIRKISFNKPYQKSLFLWFSIPLIGIFWFISLFKPTLPHWTGPGFYPLIFIAAIFIERLDSRLRKIWLTMAPAIVVLMLFAALAQINYGLFYSNTEKEVSSLGKNDVTLDMYGWEQTGEKFGEFLNINGRKSGIVIAKKWFNAAHIDYYICRPNNMTLIALGTPEDIHEYGRINKIRGGIGKGDNAYFIAVSRHFTDPKTEYGNLFESIKPVDTIKVKRGGKTVENAVIFLMKNYNPKQ
jgi:4-amino-4-deoxy-L-arabinose transferase-like glycosyltransferase